MVACVREMNRSGSASTSVLVSPRPMVPPASSKRAANSRSSGRPLKETARIVSIAALPFRTKSESGVERFYSGWVVRAPAQSARLAANPGRRRDERARQASETADVPGADGAPAQDGSGLQVPAGAARRPPGDPAARVFTRAGVQQVPRNQ